MAVAPDSSGLPVEPVSRAFGPCQHRHCCPSGHPVQPTPPSVVRMISRSIPSYTGRYVTATTVVVYYLYSSPTASLALSCPFDSLDHDALTLDFAHNIPALSLHLTLPLHLAPNARRRQISFVAPTLACRPCGLRSRLPLRPLTSPTPLHIIKTDPGGNGGM